MTSGDSMGKGVRVNLSVPGNIDALLTELAEVSGRSKASWVMEALGRYVPELHKSLEALKFGTPFESEPNAAARRFFGGTEAARAARAKGVGKAAAELVEQPMTRQQRREIERQDRKKERARTRAIQGDRTSTPENGWSG